MAFGFLTRCAVDLVRNPFSALGSVRTATKRAGGTVHNHGGSPGKRLGVKKFSGPHLIFISRRCESTGDAGIMADDGG
ncbi:hypothetical protein B0H14DRAFT_2661127 [Mycena olivaceomarginata]|nr:hypothetical protein B0H14DRAFT_2661127 [Mycena olivaceomarginata]